MAKYEVEQAFRRAAKTVFAREVTDQELGRIVENYERASGTTFDRAIRGLALGTGATEQQVRLKAASSDDANRVMQDLNTVLDKSR